MVRQGPATSRRTPATGRGRSPRSRRPSTDSPMRSLRRNRRPRPLRPRSRSALTTVVEFDFFVERRLSARAIATTEKICIHSESPVHARRWYILRRSPSGRRIAWSIWTESVPCCTVGAVRLIRRIGRARRPRRAPSSTRSVVRQWLKKMSRMPPSHRCGADREASRRRRRATIRFCPSVSGLRLAAFAARLLGPPRLLLGDHGDRVGELRGRDDRRRARRARAGEVRASRTSRRSSWRSWPRRRPGRTRTSR